MSLLQTISFRDHKIIVDALSKKQCERIATIAKINIQLSTVKPAEALLKKLDRAGCTIQRLAELIAISNEKVKYYEPQAKVAILVANDRYKHLSPLATPSTDCDAIGRKLQDLGFIVVKIKNTTVNILKEISRRVCNLIPEDSYAFVFLAGHGCQVCNTKCLLSVDCPQENIQFEHCFTENHILKELERCKLDLCVLILDMCRVYLDRNLNPQIYKAMSSIDEYTVHKNLVVSCSCQSSSSAYEVVEIECSAELTPMRSVNLKNDDIKKIVTGSSQYVLALCSRLCDDLDVNSLLDRVHEDIEKSARKQKALKVQCGVEKRSLHDDAIGDKEALLSKLKEVAKQFSDCCVVY